MRIKKCIFLTVLLFTASITKAQKLAAGIRGGLSIPNLVAGGDHGNPVNSGYSSRLGPDLGLFAEFSLTRHFSIEPMIEYSSQGGKKNGMQGLTTPDEIVQQFPAGQAPQYVYANYKSEAILNYLLVPVLAKLGWRINGSPLQVYVDVGPFAGYLIAAKQVTKGQSPIYLDAEGKQSLPGSTTSFDNTSHIIDRLHRVNAGLEGNLGISYGIQKSKIFIEGGGNYGFVNIQKESQNGKNETGAAVITFGYAYTFK